MVASVLASAGGTALTPRKSWEQVTSPETLGWDAAKLKGHAEYSTTILTAAVMIIVDGRVPAEWATRQRNTNVHSIRKSFLSALCGHWRA